MMIYLDHNATTPVDPEVKAAICEAVDIFGNPSSNHQIGHKARDIIEDARVNVARLINAYPDEILFTSGGTESNNIALLGFANPFSSGHIISSSIEHPAIIQPLKYLEEKGLHVTYLPVNRDGKINIDELIHAFQSDTILITIMHSNNETGVIQPIHFISGIAKEKGVVFHTDAAQSIGKIQVDVNSPSVDMMTIACHKFYGPKGIGALYIRREIELKRTIFGAEQERGLSPGTENILGIVGLGKACEISLRDLQERQSHSQRLTNILYSKLKENIKNINVNGDLDDRLPNTINIIIPGINTRILLDKLKDEIAASTSAACHAAMTIPSHVLKAMGLSDEDALSSIRFSVGKDNSKEDIINAVHMITKAVNELKSSIGVLE